ncbi:MAG: hypothetical protein O2867_02660 [Bacteroidetes bacterium]|nr:hypothetical protein [Bacteroidota bacterium]
MMKYLISIALCSLIAVFSKGQRGTGDRLFTVDANHRASGWFLGLGAANLFPQDEHEMEFLAIPDFPDSGSYNALLNPTGKLGFALEGGMFWLLQDRFFDYVDLGLTYRQLRGGEESSANLLPGASDTLPSLLLGEGSFQQDVVGLNVNLNKIFPLNDRFYIIQGLGADLEYRVIDDYSYDGGLASMNRMTPEDGFRTHIHYKLGAGFKTSAFSWLSLSAETPIENIIPFDGLTSRRDIFNSKYRPVVFTLRYMWLRKRPARECPTAGPSPKMKSKRKLNRGGGQLR